VSVDLAGAIGRVLTADAINRVSLLVGENPHATRLALDRAIPTVLAGLIGLASAAPGAAELAGWVGGRPEVREAAQNEASLLEGGEGTRRALAAGQDLLARLFGERLVAVGDLVARTSGVSATSAVLLLSLAGMLALGVLRSEAGRSGSSPAELGGVLVAQRSAVADLAPPGLADAMGVSSIAGVGATPLPATAGPRPRTPLVWLLPILLAVVLIGALASFIAG
jgi:hypothetical protein